MKYLPLIAVLVLLGAGCTKDVTLEQVQEEHAEFVAERNAGLAPEVADARRSWEDLNIAFRNERCSMLNYYLLENLQQDEAGCATAFESVGDELPSIDYLSSTVDDSGIVTFVGEDGSNVATMTDTGYVWKLTSEFWN